MSENDIDQVLAREAGRDLKLAAATAHRAATKIKRANLPVALASRLDDFADFLLEAAEQVRTQVAEPQEQHCKARKNQALGHARQVARRLRPAFSFERLQRD